MELPYWPDMLADPTLLWRMCCAFGFGCLMGFGIVWTADRIGWPKYLANSKETK